MCGRFVNHIQALRGWLDILGDWPADIPTGYNVAPTQTVPAVQTQGTFPMRWGLVPAWSKEASPKYATFNAHLESASTKPAFRNAWTHSQTSPLPALGYYEWCTEQGRNSPTSSMQQKSRVYWCSSGIILQLRRNTHLIRERLKAVEAHAKGERK